MESLAFDFLLLQGHCSVDEGTTVDGISLYFSKAFDKDPHGILLNKLSSCEMNSFVLH